MIHERSVLYSSKGWSKKMSRFEFCVIWCLLLGCFLSSLHILFLVHAFLSLEHFLGHKPVKILNNSAVFSEVIFFKISFVIYNCLGSFFLCEIAISCLAFHRKAMASMNLSWKNFTHRLLNFWKPLYLAWEN